MTCNSQVQGVVTDSQLLRRMIGVQKGATNHTLTLICQKHRSYLRENFISPAEFCRKIRQAFHAKRREADGVILTKTIKNGTAGSRLPDQFRYEERVVCTVVKGAPLFKIAIN